MGVHGGGTSVAPSQLRTPTQLETQVMERAGIDTNCSRPLARSSFRGGRLKVCRRAVRLRRTPAPDPCGVGRSLTVSDQLHGAGNTMRRGGPRLTPPRRPNSWSCPARLSWTEIANIWAGLSRVHRAGKDQATKNLQVLTHGRNQNLAIGVEQPRR
jgi:hypothetical protein